MDEFRFPNGVSVTRGADIDVMLNEIADLKVGEVLDAVSPYLHGESALIVFTPPAEQMLGLPPDPVRKRMKDQTSAIEVLFFDVAPRRVSLSVEFPLFENSSAVQELIEKGADSWRSLNFDRVAFRPGSEVDEVEITFVPDERIELGELALDCLRVIASIRGTLVPPLSPQSAIETLRSLAWESFLGAGESNWLEAKAKMWGLDNDAQQWELALDVSSFANSSNGGLIIVGFKTERDRFERDVIVDTKGIRRLSGTVPRVEGIINHRVVPHPRDLTVEVLERDDHGILVIHVPAQPSDQLPFIVRGSQIEGDKLVGSGFSWVERRGTSKRTMLISEVQQRLRGTRGP